jgi:L-rhamnose isomerase
LAVNDIFFEIIFVDDGSDFEYKNNYEKYFSKYENLKIIYHDL